jgi:hypothetical protein
LKIENVKLDWTKNHGLHHSVPQFPVQEVHAGGRCPAEPVGQLPDLQGTHQSGLAGKPQTRLTRQIVWEAVNCLSASKDFFRKFRFFI